MKGQKSNKKKSSKDVQVHWKSVIKCPAKSQKETERKKEEEKLERISWLANLVVDIK